ncbi:hypothetical protein [Spirosoma aerophilum]
MLFVNPPAPADFPADTGLGYSIGPGESKACFRMGFFPKNRCRNRQLITKTWFI